MVLAVALGAFGAHGLKARLDVDALAQWHTGVQYHFLHAMGLLVLAALGDRAGVRAVRLARTFFLLGTAAFSGSLYFLATRDLCGTHGLTSALGPITPLGGLFFMAGWATLLITALRGGRHD